MFTSVQGKNVLVTGASGGIGSAVAALFAEHGAAVGVHYHRDRAAALAVRNRIDALGGKAYVFQADLTRLAECRRLVKEAVARLGGLDVLVNNAGIIAGYGDFQDLSERDWDRTFALNARAPFYLARAAFAPMSRRGGRIINISSISAKYGGSRNSLHYGASKAALEAVTRGLARSWAKRGILVNAIEAGFIDTDVHRRLGRTGIATRVAMIPVGRAGRAADVARAALFLASQGGDFVTGQTFGVTGGE